MKINGELLETMRAAIAPLDTPERRDAYRRGEFNRSAAVKNLDLRYQTDLASAAGVYRLAYDAGANDRHVETALRRIVPPLGFTTAAYLS